MAHPRVDDLQIEIDHRLRAHPETGEQWADICALEAELVALRHAPDVKLIRAIGMFGTCRDMDLYRDGERIGSAHLTITADGPLWYISARGAETTMALDPALTNGEALAAVELTLRLLVSADDDARTA